MPLSRLRGSAPFLAAILVVVALVCGFSVATSVFIEDRATQGLRSELALRAGDDLALRASLDLADNAEQQDDEVRDAIAEQLAPTGIRFTVTRTLESGAFYQLNRESGAASAATIDDLESRAEFETGSVAQGPNETAVQADAAAALGLTVGDEVVINEVPFRVSGTWRALDPLDPRWYGDETVATGGTDRKGPFVITEAAWAQFDPGPTAVWTIVPVSIDEFTATNSVLVGPAWATAKEDWRGEVSESNSLAIQRRLARTLDEFAARIEGLRAIEPVAAVLVAGSALVVLSQLVQLLVATRERETFLFWARGQATVAIARRTALEVGGTALVGGALGAGVVAVLTAVRPSAFIVPVVVVVGAIVFAAVASYRSAVSVTTSTRGGRGSARARRVAVPGAVILIAIGAALAVWQLRLYGSPLTPDAEGSSSVDPIVVVAPAAALVAVVLAALAVFPAIVALYAKRTARSGVTSHLSARTLARQTSRVAAPLVIVALAVGSLTVAASFAATWDRLFTETAALHAGADLRVSSPLAPLSAEQIDTVTATDDVEAVAPLDVQTLSVAAVTGTVLAASPQAVRPEDADAIRLDQPGPVVPADATQLTLRVEAVDFVTPPALSASIVDSLGRVRGITFDAPKAEAGDVLAYRATLDSGAAGTLISIDVSFAGDQIFEEEPASFSLVGIDADGTNLELDQVWVLDTLSDQLFPPFPNSDGNGFRIEEGLPSVRMTATLDGTVNDVARPNVVVTQRLATLLELEPGDLISFSLRDVVGSLTFTVARITPAIPGADSDLAVLIDLAVINHFHQRASKSPPEPTDLWVTTEAPDEVRTAIRDELPANALIETSEDSIARGALGAAAIALWIAAACCVLIALVAVGAASSSRLRWGRNDIASLRAIGVSARGQSAVVLRELGLVLGVAVLAGLVAGALVCVLTVPQLASAAVDRAYVSLGAELLVEWPGLGILLGALAVGVAVILVNLARRVRSLASTVLPSEEHE